MRLKLVFWPFVIGKVAKYDLRGVFLQSASSFGIP